MRSYGGLLLLLGLGASTGCDEYGPVAPDGARLLLSVSRDTLRGPGDSAVIAAAVILESGDLVEYEAAVTFTTTRGGLCAAASGCGGDIGAVPAIKATASGGVALVSIRSAADTGAAVVRAQSGEARDSIVVPIVAAEP